MAAGLSSNYAANVLLQVDMKDSGLSTRMDRRINAMKEHYDKLSKMITASGYFYLSLKRIATYTGIFSFFGSMVRMGQEVIEVDKRLAEVSTLLDLKNKAVAASFEVVKQQLLTFNPALASTSEAAKGLYEIMSAGVSNPVEAMKLLQIAAEYAKGGLTDLATSASVLTSIMKAYNLRADEMRKVSDILFTSVQEGKFHVEELNDAMGTVLPTAAIMGVDIKEIAAALAVFSQRGLSAGEAATALNRFLLTLFKPGAKAQKLFEQMGMAWGIDAMKGKTLVGVLGELRGKMATHADLLQILFTRERGMRAAFIGMTSGYDEIIKMIKKEEENMMGAGVTHEAASKMMDTVSNSLSTMMNRFKQTAQGTLNYKKSIMELIEVLGWLGNNMMRNVEAIGVGGAIYGLLKVRLGGVVRGLNETTAQLTTNTGEWKASEAALTKYVNQTVSRQQVLSKQRVILESQAKAGKDVTAKLKAVRSEQYQLARSYNETAPAMAAANGQLHAQNVALTASTLKMQKLAMRIHYWSLAIMGVTALYVLLKGAIDSWKASLDAEIKKIVESSDALAARNRELKNMVALQNELTGSKLTFPEASQGLRNMVGEVVRELMKGHNSVEYWIKKIKDLYKDTDFMSFWKDFEKSTTYLGAGQYGSPVEKIELSTEKLTEFVKKMMEAGPVTDNEARLLDYLGRSLKGVQDLAKERYFEKYMKEAVVSLKDARVQAARFNEAWSQMNRDLITDTKEVARSLAPEDVQRNLDMLAKWKALISEKGAKEGTIAFEFRKGIQGTVQDIDALLPVIDDLLALYKNVQRIQPSAIQEQLNEEAIRRLGEAFDKVQPPIAKSTASMAALVHWYGLLKDKSEESRNWFYQTFKDDIEVITAGWEDLMKVMTPEQIEMLKPFYERMLKEWSTKGKGIEEKIKDIYDRIANRATDAQALIDRLNNEIMSKQNENIVAMTNKFAEKWQRALDDDIAALRKLGVEEAQLLLMQKAEQERIAEAIRLAKVTSVVREIDEIAKLREDEIRDMQISDKQRLVEVDKLGKELAQNLEKLSGVVTPEELAILREYVALIIRLMKGDFVDNRPWYERTASALQDVAQAFSTTSTSVKELIDTLGITNGPLVRFVGVLDAVSKSIRGIAESLQLMKYGTIGKVAGIIGVVVNVVSGLVGIFKSIFGGKSKAEKEAEAAQKAIDAGRAALLRFGKVSDEIAKQWSELAKKFGKAAATLLMLGDVLSEVGVKTSNWRSALKGINDLLETIAKRRKSGQNITDYVTSLNEAMQKFIEFLVESGNEGTKSFIKMIQRARELGLSIKALNEYVYEWLDKGVDGVSKLIDSIDLASESVEEFKNIFEVVSNQISEFSDNNVPALVGFSEVFEEFIGLAKRFGQEGSASFLSVLEAVRATGLQIASMNEYVFSAVEAGIGGLSSMVSRFDFKELTENMEQYKKDQEELVKIQTEVAAAQANFEQVDQRQIERMEELQIEMANLTVIMANLRDGFTETFSDDMIRAGDLAVSLFAGLVNQGMSLSDAWSRIAEPISALRDRYEELGMTADGTLGILFEFDQITEANEGLLDSVEGVRQILNALGKVGYLSMENFVTISEDAVDMFQQLQNAGVDGETALRMMVPTLADLEYFAEQYGFTLDESIQSLIDMAREAGIYQERQLSLNEVLQTGFDNLVATINELISRLPSLASGITDVMNVLDSAFDPDAIDQWQGRIEQATTMLLALFNSMVAQGMSFTDALLKIEEPLTSLREKYRALGLTGNEAIEQLFRIVDVQEANQGLVDAISGTQQVLRALGNTGFLTQESLASVQGTAAQMYQQLVANNVDQRTALAMLSPILSDLLYYSQQNEGLVLDEFTLALIQQAQELGVFREHQAELGQQIYDGLQIIGGGVNDFHETFRGYKDYMMDWTERFSRDFLEGMYIYGHGGISQAQSGMTNVGETQLIQVHRGESIIPENISSALRTFFGGSGSVRAGSESGTAEVSIEIDGRQFYKAIVPYFKKGLGKGDMEVSGHGVY